MVIKMLSRKLTVETVEQKAKMENREMNNGAKKVEIVAKENGREEMI